MSDYVNGVLQNAAVPGNNDAQGLTPLYGVTLPSNPTEGQIFELLKRTQVTQVFTQKIDRTGENTAADFGNRSVGIFTLHGSTGLHIPFDSVLDAIHFRGLQPNDQIIATADGQTDAVITLSQAMTWESDSGTLFSPSAGGYSHTGSIVDDVRYTLYAIRVNRYFDARTLLKSVDGRWYVEYQPLNRWLESEPPHEVGLHWNLDTQQTDFDVFTATYTRTGEETAADVDATKVFHWGALIIPVADATAGKPLTDLRKDDKIILSPDSGEDVVYRITGEGTPVSYEASQSVGGNTLSAVVIAGQDFSRTGQIEDGVEYTIYAVRNRVVPKGSTLKSNGLRWEEIFIEDTVDDKEIVTPEKTHRLLLGTDAGDKSAAASEVLKLSDFPIDRHGTSLPTTDLVRNQTFRLLADADDVQTYTDMVSRVHHSTYGDNTIGVFSGTLQIQFPTQAAAQAFLDLESGHKIIANRQDEDETVTATLSASPTWNATNKSVDVASTGFTLSGDSFTAGRTYDVWAFVVEDRRAGSLFITNGEYWMHFWTPKVPAWVGSRRQNKTALTVSTSDNLASLMTSSITPSRAGALIRIRVQAFTSLTSAPSQYGYILTYARVKKGSGSYTGIDGTDTLTYLKGHLDVLNYQDALQQSGYSEFYITAQDTDTLKVNVCARPQHGGENQSNLYFNRNTNNNDDGEIVSFLELTEFKDTDDLNPIEITTVTTADAA